MVEAIADLERRFSARRQELRPAAYGGSAPSRHDDFDVRVVRVRKHFVSHPHTSIG
jgi:hypothetical protein